MKIRNCEKVLMKFLDRQIKAHGTRVEATSKEINACEALNKYKPHKLILGLVHVYTSCIDGKKGLSVWVGG